MKSPPNFYRVIQIILQMCLCDQSLVTLGFLWGRLSQPQFHKALTRKIPFLRGGLEILQQCDKRVNTKSKKFWWSIRTFVEVTSDKMVRGEGVRRAICSPPPILNRVNSWKLLSNVSKSSLLHIAMLLDMALCFFRKTLIVSCFTIYFKISSQIRTLWK